MNRVFISGNLGQKPEVRKAKTGTPVGNFNVATNQRVKKGDEWVDQTDWHRIVVFGKTAENCERFLDKGSKVIVEGRLQNRSYEDKQGNQRKTTEIVASNVEFIGRRDNGDGDRQPPPQSRQQSSGGYPDEEIPF